MRKESSQKSARSKKKFLLPRFFFFFSYDTRIQSGFLDFDHKIEIK